MRIVGNNPQLSRQTQGTASGAITGGKPVVVNTDGTVSEISATAQAVGTAVVYETSESHNNKVTFDSNSNRIVVAYRDQGNSGYGSAVVGTVSGTSISFGSVVVFESANSEIGSIVFDSSNNKVVIFYADNGNSSHGTAIVGTVDSSDNSISFGTPVVFNSASTDVANGTGATFDSSNNKVVVAYRDGGDSNKGKAIVGTVSGTGISFGTEAEFNNASTIYIDATFDTNANKVVIVYQDAGDGDDGTAIVGTVSGTDITFGTEAEYTSNQANWNGITFDSSNNKVIIVYSDGSNSKGKALVGTISGTSISFGSEVVFNDAATTNSAVTFDSSTGNPVVAYQDDGGSNFGRFAVGTVSGTDITFASEVAFESASVEWVEIAYDSTNERVVTVFEDTANSNYGTAVVVSTGVPTNITSENFIGFAEDTVATGQPVTINTKGAIADNIPSLPFTITYDSKSFDHSSQDAIAEEIRFKPDGTKFYLLTNDNDIIYQYSMSSAWDISTASYESKNFNVQSQEGTPQGMAINADGSSFYICGQSRVVYQYNLTTDYDISTASYASKSFSLTTQMSSGSAWSLDFDSTGTKMYAIHSNSGIVYQYTLSSAFDVSTASYASKSFDTSSQTSDPTSIAITSDGTSLYVVSSASDQVFKYTLSTAFDLATASYSGISLTTTSQDNFPMGVAVKTDETKLYVTGTQNDSVYQYSLADSLTPAQTYFVQTDGTLSETADSPSVTAGTAVAGSTLIVKG